jgi:hypothetical protein
MVTKSNVPTVILLCVPKRNPGISMILISNRARVVMAARRGIGVVLLTTMQKLYSAIEQADTLVLDSPVYMGHMSAQARIFTDRLFAQFSPIFSPHCWNLMLKRYMSLPVCEMDRRRKEKICTLL